MRAARSSMWPGVAAEPCETLAAILLAALVAVVPYLTDACLVHFGVLNLSSGIHSMLVVPLALNEMVLAVWLLTKGFRNTDEYLLTPQARSELIKKLT